MSSSLPRLRPVTIEDVARAADVAKATAARALGGYGPVSPAVKARVQAAAAALGYRANELARSMATGRSGIIGVIVGDIENPYFSLAVRGISDGAKALGFGVILSNSGEDVAEEKAAVDMLIGKQVDGLIVAPAMQQDVAHLQAASRSGRPLVLMDRGVPDLAVDCVVMDDRAAAAAATRLLIAAGHRRLAYVTATPAHAPVYSRAMPINLSTVRHRIGGMLAACHQARVADPSRYIRFGATRGAISQRIIADLLALPDRPTAILASDNLVALDVFRALKAFAMKVPRDLSLVTFHDGDWTGATTPAVTVVAQPAYRLGEDVARMLVERITGLVAPPRRRVLRTSLIVRESVAPPPDSGLL